MALDFGLISNEYEIDHGTLGSWGSSLDDFTCFNWVYPTDNTGTCGIFNSDASGTGALWLSIIVTDVYVGYSSGSGSTRALAAGDLVTNNEWQFFAGVIERGAGNSAQKVYRGTRTSIPVEPGSYHIQEDNAAQVNHGSETKYFGVGDPSMGENWAGKIAFYALYEGALSDAEIQKVYEQSKRRPGVPVHFDNHILKVWCIPGFYGDKFVPDFSGNRFHGICNSNLVLAPYEILGTPFSYDIEYGRSLTDYILTADSGSYAITGTLADLLKGYLIAAASGSYSISGSDADLIYSSGYNLTAEAGSYLISGTAAALKYARIMTAESGAYILTGSVVELLKGYKIAAEGGSYTISGIAASLLIAYLLSAEAGSYSITGAAATLTYSGLQIPVGEVTITFSALKPEITFTAKKPKVTFS